MRNCDVCGKDISNLDRRAKRCSYECMLEHKRRLHLQKQNGRKVCVTCRTKFKPVTANQRSCSKVCAKTHKHKKHNAKLYTDDRATEAVRFNNLFLLAG